MKKIIGIIFISLMFANIGFAAQRQIEEKFFDGGVIQTYCIDGYKFVVTIVPYPTADVPKTGVTMVQAFEVGGVGATFAQSVPTKC